MRTLIATLVLLAADVAADGAQPQPLPKTGVCPSGYASSSAYCMPVSDRSPRRVCYFAPKICSA